MQQSLNVTKFLRPAQEGTLKVIKSDLMTFQDPSGEGLRKFNDI